MARRKGKKSKNKPDPLLERFLSDADKVLMLIDGTSLAFRGYYAFIKNPLRNSKGENTSAPFAFTNSVLKLLKDYNPTHVAIVFDAKGPTFRHEQFKAYKANRPESPKEFHVGMRWVKRIAKAMGFKVFEIPGVEADDVIATLVERAKKETFKVLLVTSDKDLLQLVNDKVIAIDTRPKETVVYDRKAVFEKYGVPPELIPDFLALCGDPIDNIPGIPGIGPRRAAELLNQFGSIENIFDKIDYVRSKSLRDTLARHLADAFEAKELTELKKDVDLEFEWDDLKPSQPDRAELMRIFRELEFGKLMEMFADYPPQLEVVESKDLNFENGFAITAYGNDLFAAAEGSGPVIRLKGVFSKGGSGQAALFSAATSDSIDFPDVLSDPSKSKWCFDSKSVYRKALFVGRSIEGIEFDMKLAVYLCDPAKPKYTLEYLALEYAGFKVHENLPHRAADELAVVLKTKDALTAELEEKGLSELFYSVELPLARVLARMEHHGVLVDTNFLRLLGKRIESEIEQLRRRIFELAGTTFNLNSPQQLAHVLFERLKLPPIKRTKTGYSTSADVLAKLAEKHELPRLILEYRELFKVKSTYVDALIRMVNPQTGRIHPTFNQTGTVTGRLSCSDPNLQNIPIRSDIGREIRRAFVAPSGSVILSADYSQIELRILAHVTGDENLIAAFREGLDIHAATAGAIFGKPPETVNSIERRKAKIVNFGVTYGMSPFGLAKELGITPEEAAVFIFNYFATYPKVKEWIERTLEEAREKGYVKTILGRRRYIPEINSSNGNVRAFAERTAINAPIQGSAADLIKKAMVELDEAIRRSGLRTRMILQIHDELVFEVPESELDEVKELVKEKMENAIKLSVPIVVDIGVGKNWLEAHA